MSLCPTVITTSHTHTCYNHEPMPTCDYHLAVDDGPSHTHTCQSHEPWDLNESVFLYHQLTALHHTPFQPSAPASHWRHVPLHCHCSVFYLRIATVLCCTSALPLFCVVPPHRHCSVLYLCIATVLCCIVTVLTCGLMLPTFVLVP